MKSVCVFCGSGTGSSPLYAEAAAALGVALAKRNLNLVYGGSNVGLMGAVSTAARDAGAAVTGVIPRRIAEFVPGQDGIALEVVEDMHSRKNRMYQLSDAFVALPGGIGTMDEFFETWTWNHLGYHSKALGLLNVDDYYTPLLAFLDQMTSRGFLNREQRDTLAVANNPEGLLDTLKTLHPVEGLSRKSFVSG